MSIHYRTVDVAGHRVAYREAGDPARPTLLLLHGFPTSSHMFRDLIPLLADRFHLVAPDLPGFGFTESPDRGQFAYTFDNLAAVVDGFTQALSLQRYAIYVFDYGAPVGFRRAACRGRRGTGPRRWRGTELGRSGHDGRADARARRDHEPLDLETGVSFPGGRRADAEEARVLRGVRVTPHVVMAGLVPAIHAMRLDDRFGQETRHRRRVERPRQRRHDAAVNERP